MSFAMSAVLAAAACSGAATVLQARAAQREPARRGLDATLLVRLVRRPGYVIALALVAAGFALSLYALRTLPLFVVQAGRASSLAVTALLAVLLLRARLSRWEVGAVIAVVAGVVLLGAAAGAGGSGAVPAGTRLGLLVALIVVAAAGGAATKIRSIASSGLVLGALAGASFAILALGARILRGFEPATLVVDPAAWAIGVGGALGLLLAAMALQRASVVSATAPMVATETVLGAALGMALCGDRPVPGSAFAAALGFTLVLAGALSLARFSALDRVTAASESLPAPVDGRR